MSKTKRLFAMAALPALLAWASTAAAQVALPRKPATPLRAEPAERAQVAARVDGAAQFDWPQGRVIKLGQTDTRGSLLTMPVGTGRDPGMPMDMVEINRQWAEVSYVLPTREEGNTLWLALQTGSAHGWGKGEEFELGLEQDWPLPADAMILIPLRKDELPKIKEGPIPRVVDFLVAQKRDRVVCEFMVLTNPKGEVALVRRGMPTGVVWLDEEIERVLKRWKFGQAKVEGRPAHVLVRLRLEFRLVSGRISDRP